MNVTTCHDAMQDTTYVSTAEYQHVFGVTAYIVTCLTCLPDMSCVVYFGGSQAHRMVRLSGSRAAGSDMSIWER